MAALAADISMDWSRRPAWGRASYHKIWCPIGCAVGDLGAILFFQLASILRTVGATLIWLVAPFMIFAGFLAPLPSNQWRLKALGKVCRG